ncbi:alpha/beta fold hydrolase [Salinicola aestuarinus]|uniref:alpha/beta fold hydrolase n=1 Tax=Salinicola aestuarinus TaxID=1949082 RepID=UPI000DA25CC1|nr:alpha/beta hydrolase [Salinicola aestuarinus]
MSAEALSLNGGRHAALCWGRRDAPIWLALHGWLDNAASFTRVAPLLVRELDIRLVAVDLPGHGHSAARGEGADYPMLGYLPDVVDVLDALALESVTLLGHSLGASIATQLAAALPERVERLVLIDGLIGTTVEVEEGMDQLRLALQSRRRVRAESRGFDSVEAAVAARVSGGVTRLDEASARPIVERNLARDANGRFQWRTDRRLTWPSLSRLTPAQALHTVERVVAPALLVQATQGVLAGQALAATARQRMPQLTRRVLAGGHHLHLERLQVAAVAAEIVAWTRRQMAAAG